MSQEQENGSKSGIGGCFSSACISMQQLLEATKNPIATFALLLFLYGVTLSPAMSVATCIASSDECFLRGSSDYCALQFGFVSSWIIILVFSMEKLTLLLSGGKCTLGSAHSCGKAVSSRLCSVSCVVVALGIFASWSFFSRFFTDVPFQVILILVMIIAPCLLVARSNSFRKEQGLSLEVSVSLRELSGNILLFAVCPTLLLVSLFLGVAGYVYAATLSLCWISAAVTVTLFVAYALMVHHYAKVY